MRRAAITAGMSRFNYPEYPMLFSARDDHRPLIGREGNN